jgi:hypothetical protein
MFSQVACELQQTYCRFLKEDAGISTCQSKKYRLNWVQLSALQQREQKILPCIILVGE